MVLLTQVRHAPKLSIRLLCWHWDWWLWWPEGLLFPPWLWGSQRRHGEQSLDGEICGTSVAPQAPWCHALETSRSPWAACALFSCCSWKLHLGIKIWPKNLPLYPLSVPLGFCHFALHFDLLVWAVLDALRGPLFNNLGLHWGLRAAVICFQEEMAATSMGSAKGELENL